MNWATATGILENYCENFYCGFVWQRVNNGKYCKKRDRGFSQTCCATNFWWCEFFISLSFYADYTMRQRTVDCFSFISIIHQFQFFDLLWWGWLFCFFASLLPFAFLFFIPLWLHHFLVAGLFTSGSAYKRYLAPVTFFCLSSLFITVNLIMYNISLSPHFLGVLWIEYTRY